MALKYPLYLELIIKDSKNWIVFNEKYYVTDYPNLCKKINDCYFVYKLDDCNYEFSVLVRSKVNRLIGRIEDDN